jgi:hypothetical protein
MSLVSMPRRFGWIHCAATGAAVLVVLFLLCWLAAAFTSLTVSHMYISLFTVAPISSAAALIAGLCWSMFFGAVTGALVAVFFNLLAGLDPNG